MDFATSSFVYQNKEFDIKVNNNLYEIDGDFWHPSKLENLSLIQIASTINDYKKNILIDESVYVLYRIHVFNLPNDINEQSLQNNSYISNHKITNNQKIINKEYIARYIKTKTIEKLYSYISLLLKFLNAFKDIIEPLIDINLLRKYQNIENQKLMIYYIIGQNKENKIYDLTINNFNEILLKI